MTPRPDGMFQELKQLIGRVVVLLVDGHELPPTKLTSVNAELTHLDCDSDCPGPDYHGTRLIVRTTEVAGIILPTLKNMHPH